MGCLQSKSDDTLQGLSPNGIALSTSGTRATGPSESEKHIELHIASRNKRNNVIAQAQLDGDIETPNFGKTPNQENLILYTKDFLWCQISLGCVFESF